MSWFGEAFMKKMIMCYAMHAVDHKILICPHYFLSMSHIMGFLTEFDSFIDQK